MLQLHRASRGDRLAAGLAEVLRGPVADPFVREVVSVPTRGVERWLSQQLSGVLGARPGSGDGVCANVDFPFPGSLVGNALVAATGVGRETDPWLPERSVWPLLAVVDEALEEEWLAPLATHLGASARLAGARHDDDRPDRRFSAVRHLADLFDRYGVHRPHMLRAWAKGVRLAPDADGAWQAELWWRLRERIAVPSPAERLVAATEQLIAAPGLVDLPGRLSLFGLTRLPASYLDVLAALGQHRDVHLWLLHPSPALWDRLATEPLGAPAPHPSVPRRSDPTADLPANPLLRTWGRDAREMQLVLAGAGALTGEVLADPDPDDSLLGRIQADIRADREPPLIPLSDVGDPRPVLADHDRSVQVHACHGRARQVEVLRDAIVHLLAEDETLEQRDIIVMCPDIEEFAPLIHATFGPGGEAEGVALNVRLADRSLRQTNPVLGALARLLELAGSRVTASDLLDMAGTAPVRARFGFDDDELARADNWIRSAGVRWGIDAAWRSPYHLDRLAYGTWAAGVDRLLTGVVMSEEPWALVGGVLPLDDVDSGDIDLAGRVAELVSRVAQVLETFSEPRTVGGWVAALDMAADLLLGTAPADEWQRAQLRRLLDDVSAQAATHPGGPDTELRPAELRALMGDRLRGVPTRANFRTGHLTMCTLVPMRSVPHRVICLLGLDDGAFPRRTSADGDDLLAADPCVGDRDPRSEDRQLLLDAVLAARETLIITYSGRDERTNAPRPPAIPVGELLDVIDRTVRVDEGPARQRIVVEHPLQTFDERNFVPGRLIPERAWSFDQTALDGALAARRSRAGPAPEATNHFTELLPPWRPDPVVVDDLLRFVEHPVKAFLRQRLGISPRGDWSDPGDAIAIELDALDRWQVGDRMLDARLAGIDLDDCRRAELARGSLPPDHIGREILDRLLPGVESLVHAVGATGARTLDPRSLDVSATLPDGVVVAGTIGDMYGEELRTVTYSRLGPKQRLVAWVRLLVLTVSQPELPWRTLAVGRGRGHEVAIARIGPLGPDPTGRAAVASEALAVIVDLYWRGMREPLPLAAKTSMAWAAAARAGRRADTSASNEWVTPFGAGFPREDSDPAHRLVHGPALPWEGFLAFAPAPDETGPGWDDHPSRAGRLAIRLWSGLLAVEDLRTVEALQPVEALQAVEAER